MYVASISYAKVTQFVCHYLIEILYKFLLISHLRRTNALRMVTKINGKWQIDKIFQVNSFTFYADVQQ